MSARPNLFGADIAGAIAQAMGSDMLPVTLTRTAAGTRDPDALTGGPTVGETSATYTCRGFMEDFTSREIDGTNVRVGDRKVIILGGTLTTAIDPQPGDVLAIEGGNWKISGAVKRDPAGATFTCPVRR